MAQLFQISDSINGYNLDECEEVLLIAAYLEAKKRVGHQSWLIEFEKKFFDDDKGVSDYILAVINTILRDAGQQKLLLKFRPSRRTQYMAARGIRKTQSRAELLSLLSSHESGAANRKLAEARTALASLDPPDEEYRDIQETLLSYSNPKILGEQPIRPPRPQYDASAPILSAAEIGARALALRAANPVEPEAGSVTQDDTASSSPETVVTTSDIEPVPGPDPAGEEGSSVPAPPPTDPMHALMERLADKLAGAIDRHASALERIAISIESLLLAEPAPAPRVKRPRLAVKAESRADHHGTVANGMIQRGDDAETRSTVATKSKIRQPAAPKKAQQAREPLPAKRARQAQGNSSATARAKNSQIGKTPRARAPQETRPGKASKTPRAAR